MREMTDAKFLTTLLIVQLIVIVVLSLIVLGEPTVDECIDIIWESE